MLLFSCLTLESNLTIHLKTLFGFQIHVFRYGTESAMVVHSSILK